MSFLRGAQTQLKNVVTNISGADLNIVLVCAQIDPKNVCCLSVCVATLVFAKVVVYLGKSRANTAIL